MNSCVVCGTVRRKWVSSDVVQPGKRITPSALCILNISPNDDTVIRTSKEDMIAIRCLYWDI
eukprot:m.261276 g.261276  ORF g.261276 m.261276 type:complete len:62 (+) comp41789_c0_seq1:961-1146(+)